MTKKTRLVKSSEFPYAIRSFLGYLEGTSKALHTIKSYRLDLLSFQRFLQSEQSLSGHRAIPLESITSDNIERYHSWLKSQGLKNNTRRRKLLTVQKFLNYLVQRKKAPVETAVKYPTPHKVERIPHIVPIDELLTAIQALPDETLLDFRNRVLLWTLAETACLVSEVTRLKYGSWGVRSESQGSHSQAVCWVDFGGKSPRKVPVSEKLYQAILDLKSKAGSSEKEEDWIFLGFNKFGSLGAPITTRGVELLVKHYAHPLGFPELTPRTFRHSAVIHWFRKGLTHQEIQMLLGLKSQYAFRAYDAILQSGVSS